MASPQQPYPNQGHYNPPPQKGGMSTGGIIAIIFGALFLIALLIVGILALMLIPAVSQVRDAARRTSAMNQGRQMVLAVHNYHNAFRCLPINREDEEGNEIQSWRVALLPFLEQTNLADAIDPALPWNDPVNQQYTEMVVPIFHSPRGLGDSPTTHFVAVVDPKSPMSGDKITLETIASGDGTSNTALFLEFPQSDINWAEPRDVTISEAINIIQNCKEPAGTVVMMADGSVSMIDSTTSAEDITKLFLLDDGAPEELW